MSGGEKVNMAGKYEYWLSQEGQVLLQGWARDGLTDEQIAKICAFPHRHYMNGKEIFGDFGVPKRRERNS